MKHCVILKISLLLVLLLSVSWSVSAQESESGSDGRYCYSELHELELGVGYPMFGKILAKNTTGSFNLFAPLFNLFLAEDIVPELSVGDIDLSPVVRFEYGYNINKWFNVGAGVYYSYLNKDVLYRESGAFAWNESAHLMNVLLNLRAYWLNRKYVRLYSGIGIGATMLYGNLGNTSPETVGENDLLSSFALEFRLIGLQVGNDKLYGKLEIGSTGTGIINAGIGYRF